MDLAGNDLSPDTGLAPKWEESDDKLSWTLTLREGVQWDKGYCHPIPTIRKKHSSCSQKRATGMDSR